MINYLVALLTLVGTVANALGKRWSFGIWLATNIYWFIYNGANGDIPQMIIFGANAIVCIIGLKQWKRKG